MVQVQIELDEHERAATIKALYKVVKIHVHTLKRTNDLNKRNELRSKNDLLHTVIRKLRATKESQD